MTTNLKPADGAAGAVRSVLKALAALEFVTSRAMTSPGAGLSEVAEALGEKPSTTRNILKTMEDAGYIARAVGKLYKPGARLASLGRGARATSGKLLETLRPSLERIAESFGESMALTALFNGSRHVLMRRLGTGPIVIDTSNAEQNAPIYELATIHALLAFAPVSEVDLFVSLNGFPGAIWDNITTRPKLDVALAKIRRAGYAEAWSCNRSFYGIAFPAPDLDSDFVAALAIYMPATHYNPAMRKRMIAEVTKELNVRSDEFFKLGVRFSSDEHE